MDSFCSLFDPNEGQSKPKKKTDFKPDAKKLGAAPKGRRKPRRSRSKKETLPEECSFLCEPDRSTDLIMKEKSYIESFIDVGHNATNTDTQTRPKRRNSRKTRRKPSHTSDDICHITDGTCSKSDGTCKKSDVTCNKSDGTCKKSDVTCNKSDATRKKSDGACNKSLLKRLNNKTNIKSVFNDIGKNVNDLKGNEGYGVQNAIGRLEIVGLKDDMYGEINAEDLENDDMFSEDETGDTFSDSECRGDFSEESFGSLPPEPRFGNVEYKLQLVSPGERRLQHLVTQLKWRLRSGGGTAIYVLGVTDSGALRGLSPRGLRASLRTLRRMAGLLGAHLLHVQARRLTHNRAVAELYIRKLAETQQSVELRIAVMGANEAGKSTLIGVLTQGELDNGRGSARLNMFRHVHEVRSGRTSSLSHEILGFDAQGNVVNYGCSELMTAERIGERSAKLVSFIDLAGHRKYQRTTVHGLTGYSPHYAMLVISCTAGITHITEEHMSLLVALELPFFTVLTKSELQPTGVQNIMVALTALLKRHGKKPILITDEAAARTCVAPKKLIIDAMNDDEDKENNNVDNDAPIVVFPVSCVRGGGLGALHSYLLALMPPNESTPPHQDESCEFQIDEIFHVGESTGPIVGGLLARGKLYEGDQLLLGPLDTGEFVEISVKTIYRNRVPCDFVKAGQSASLGLSHHPPLLRQGMVLLAIPPNYKPNVNKINPGIPTLCRYYHQNNLKASSKKQNRKNKKNINNNLKNVEQILEKDLFVDENKNLLKHKCESSSDDKSDYDVLEKNGLSNIVQGLSTIVQGSSIEQKFEQCTCSDELILDDPDNPRGCLYFQASLRLLRHSTSYIYPGFQCTVHIGNVRQTAIIESILSSDGVLRSGEKASVVFRFARNPEYIRPYRRMLCRAGHYTTAVGRLVQVFPYVTCQT